MKFNVTLFLATLLAAQAAPPPAPDLSGATVTIPYAELRALWEAGQRKPEPVPAPVAFVVHRADVRLEIGESSSAIEAKANLQIVIDGAMQLGARCRARENRKPSRGARRR